jgi:hypothetical protein
VLLGHHPSMPIPVSHVYDELMHYTTLRGFTGIVSSGCIWATDASFLNDASEISHFFDIRLARVIAPVVRTRGIELARSPEILADMSNQGGVERVIDAEISTVVRSLREATLSMNKPYVLSLCGTADDRVRHSGLLSQWRGYGADGGYALVMDTKGLEDALLVETKSHHYMHAEIGDVYYEGIDPLIQPARGDFEELEKTVNEGVNRILRGGTAEETEGFYQAVTSLSCLCKHWGFWEEREIRLVVVPASEDVVDAVPEAVRPAKAVKSFPRGAVSVPYVELFASSPSAGLQTKLPIKRVIVGPHIDRVQRLASAKELLGLHGYDVDVTVSEIPYIGR